MAKLSPLALTTLIRHAFMSGAGYGECELIAPKHQTAWTEYEPPEPLFGRVHNALYPQTGEAIRERSVGITESEQLLVSYKDCILDLEEARKACVDDAPLILRIKQIEEKIIALMGAVPDV